MAGKGLEITVEKGGRLVRVSGVVDEGSDLSPLLALSGPVAMHLAGVRRLNSQGVRAWIDTMRKVTQKAQVEWHECSPAVIDQANMVQGFTGGATIVSFFAPLACEDDLIEDDKLFTVEAVKANGGKLPVTPCPRCKKPMTLDDSEEQVLAFLQD